LINSLQDLLNGRVNTLPVLLFTNSKLHTVYRLSVGTKIGDLEWPWTV